MVTLRRQGHVTIMPGRCLPFSPVKPKGRSTRIVGWDSSSKKLTIVALPAVAGVSVAEGDLNATHFLVNGRPFSGDGTAEDGKPRLQNEDYDKPDAYNPWLFAGSTTSGTITHDLVSFANQDDWTVDASGNPDPRARPDRDGSGDPRVAIDNDGDLTEDSVWMDVGLPLQLQADGSYVKPLVAMMVRDLDGRVNVNAHGSASQQVAAMMQQSGTAPQSLGQGYGPAEMDPFFALDVKEDELRPFNINGFLGRRMHLDSEDFIRL